MTGAEAKAAFMAKYYAETNADAAGWEDSEIEIFLQDAASAIVSELSVEEIFDPISALVVTADAFTYLTPATGISNTKRLTADLEDSISDYFFYVRSSSEVTRTHKTPSSTSIIPNEFIQAHEVNNYLETAEHVPFFRAPKIFLQVTGTGTKLFVVGDSYTDILAIILTYVKKPTIDLEDATSFTNVNLVLHEKIVNLGVQIAIRSLQTTQKSTQ